MGVLRARQRLFLWPLAAQDWDGRLCPGAALLSGAQSPIVHSQSLSLPPKEALMFPIT